MGHDDDDGIRNSATTKTTAEAYQIRNVIYRLDRLPGAVFARKGGLMHMALKSMAMDWAWHVEYDGLFLAHLPCSVKMLLLSYIGVYTMDHDGTRAMRGLSPLFLKDGEQDYFVGYGDDLEVSRLDLGGALGRWLTFKQLKNELIVSSKVKKASSTAVQVHKVEEEEEVTIPVSWDEDAGEEENHYYSPSSSSSSLDSNGLRFANLRFLSLAHPIPSAANWSSLINLLSCIKSITHLSLAHWPIPTATPNAMTATVRHPVHRSLIFSYGGTDAYTAMEDNWAEAVALLRKLSRATYCLQWLDLEGCGDWIRALCWEGVGPDGEPYGSTGSIWNGPWRNVEWIGMGPGWIPPPDLDGSSSSTLSRSLAHSIHAPQSRNTDVDDDLPWDVEVERIKYRQAKQVERFRRLVEDAETVGRRILDIRRQGKGKWVHFSLGLLDEGHKYGES